MKHMIIVVAALLLAGPASGQAPQGRPLVIEDYYRIGSIGDVQISPDGAFVAYTVSTKIEDDNTNAIDTFVVSANGSSAPRRITHERDSVADPIWVGGRTLRYSTQARVPSGIFVGGGNGAPAPPANGGAAQMFQVTVDAPNASPRKASATPPGVPSPDGKLVALASEQPQPAPAAGDETAFEKRHEERFKGRSFDWMRFQQDGRDYPVPDPRARAAGEVSIGAAGSTQLKRLTNLGQRPTGLAWHPAGSTIAFAADEDWRIEQTYERPDIYTVTTEGDVRRLTNDGYAWGSLAYSPDGRFLLAERTFGTGMIIEQKLNHGGSDDLLLWSVDAPASEPVNLTANWDLEPNQPRWSADGTHVYFTAQKGGTIHLFRVAARGGAAVEQVTLGDRRVNSITFDRAMTRMAYTVGTYGSPSEVWTARIDGSDERRLTDVFADVRRDIAITRTERLTWRSSDGTEIEGWLTYPQGFDRANGPYPMVVFNHGGPHAAVGYGFNFKQQYFAANGYFVFDTNFRSSTGYGDAFKWATWGEWGTKDGDDVMSGVDHVIANHPVDASKVATMGHSYGGFMTNWLITRYPERFAAAAAGAPISNWISDYGTADIYRTKETEFFGPPWEAEGLKRMIAQSPLMHAGKVRTPTLFIQGEADQRVPSEEAEQMYFALRRQGVPAKMIQYAGQPHGISGHWNNVHRMLNELK